MKILHVNNVANTAVVLRDAQQELGHEVLVIQTWKGFRHYNWDEDYRFSTEAGYLAAAYTMWKLSRWADVVHVHGEFTPKGLRWLGFRRRLIVHLHGDEARNGLWRKMVKFADQVILSTPDLERTCPVGLYIPNGIPLREPIVYRDANPIRVVHGHGKYGAALERTKGSLTIKRIVESLEGFEFVEVTGLPHEEALKIYATCDVLVDQITEWEGWLGVTALECMSMGIPTLSSHGPTYHTSAKTLADDLRLLRDVNLREEIGTRQRKYVAKYHDPVIIARQITELYTSPDYGPWRSGDF